MGAWTISRAAEREMDRLRAELQQPTRSVEVFSGLFSRRITADDPGQFSLATGENIAHLNCLSRRNSSIISGGRSCRMIGGGPRYSSIALQVCRRCNTKEPQDANGC